MKRKVLNKAIKPGVQGYLIILFQNQYKDTAEYEQKKGKFSMLTACTSKILPRNKACFIVNLC